MVNVVYRLVDQIQPLKESRNQITEIRDVIYVAGGWDSPGGDVESIMKKIIKGKFGNEQAPTMGRAFNNYIIEIS
jgi:hypothetical protein